MLDCLGIVASYAYCTSVGCPDHHVRRITILSSREEISEVYRRTKVLLSPTKNAVSAHVCLTALMCLLRLPNSSQNFRSATFSLVSPIRCFLYLAIERAVGDIGKFEGLRTVMCSGSVLTAARHEWMKGAFNDHAVCGTGSGGTEICGNCAYSSSPSPSV
jgi:hypothetical protein